MTQRLILRPELEANFYSKADPGRAVGAGLADIDAGLRLRYEVTRQFAPYIGVAYAGRFGETARMAGRAGERAAAIQFVFGIRTWFIFPARTSSRKWTHPVRGLPDAPSAASTRRSSHPPRTGPVRTHPFSQADPDRMLFLVDRRPAVSGLANGVRWRDPAGRSERVVPCRT